MCAYSLHNVKSRPAKVGDKLTTHRFKPGPQGSLRWETSAWQFVYFRGRNLPSQRK
jgi:hypothetical protein